MNCDEEIYDNTFDNEGIIENDENIHTSPFFDENNTKQSSENGLLYNKYQSQLIRVPKTVTLLNCPSCSLQLHHLLFQAATTSPPSSFLIYIINIPDYCFSDCTELQSV